MTGDEVGPQTWRVYPFVFHAAANTWIARCDDCGLRLAYLFDEDRDLADRMNNRPPLPYASEHECTEGNT